MANRNDMLISVAELTNESEEYIKRFLKENRFSLEVLYDIVTVHRVRAMVKRNCSYCEYRCVCARFPRLRELLTGCAVVDMRSLTKLDIFRDYD